MFAGIPGDRWGRRDSLRVMAILYLVSALGCAFAWDWYSLIFFRVIGGLGIGGSSVLGPMYIAEIAPAKWRGRLVGLFQFNVVLGILLAYLSNYLIGLARFGAAEWRWMLGVSAIPAAVFLVLLFGIPRSPRWLVKKRRMPEAREVLRLTGEENYEANCRISSRPSTPNTAMATNRCSQRKYRAADLSGGHHRDVQPAFGYQRHPVLS